MSRYIDADILRAEILKHKRETPEGYERHNEIVYILGIVDRQPTFDPKQNPKKVLKKIFPKTGNAKGSDNFWCPECKISLNMKYKLCPCCGQALDWGGEE